MRYSFGTCLKELGDREEFPAGVKKVEILTEEEFKEAGEMFPHRKTLLHSMEHLHYCKAEFFGSCIVGTLKIPDKKNLLSGNFSFGFYFKEDHLVFLDETGRLKKVFSSMKEIKYGEEGSLAHFFLGVLDYFIRDDVVTLQQYEEKLADVEEELLSKLPPNFYQTVILCRKELLTLHTYYEQLVNLGEELAANPNQMFKPEECSAFSNFSSRASRLHDHVEMLREYVLQIREMYQSQLDISQNRTMNWLTVVTTVFLPLSLITGWYGMNFSNMPELKWKYGYLGVIALLIVIVAAEILFFKKKKML